MAHAYQLSLDRSIIPTIILYVLGVSIFTWLVEPDVFAVLVASSPILLHVLMISWQRDVFSAANLFWISPVILPGIFIGLWLMGTPAIRDMDGPVLFLLQLVYSYLLLFYIYLTIRTPKTRGHTRQDRHAEHAMQEHIRKSDDERAYYQQLAYDYYDHAKQYADRIKTLQQGLKEMHNLSREKDHSDADTKELEERSRKYLQHIHELESQLRKTKSYKDVADNYAQKMKTYEGHINTLHRKLEDAERQLSITKENFEVSLRTIEDKCKAINFVIGRVYATRKGGSEDIRRVLHINRELYNSFSEITQNFSEEKKTTLLRLLYLLKRKCRLFFAKEKDLIKPAKGRVKVKRSTGDTVLDVLEKNDRDPVRDYVTEAEEICTKMIAYLEQE